VSRAVAVPLVEVFRSIQGEGLHVGRPMVFVRTAVCPIRCRYCDTPESFVPARSFRVHDAEGRSREEENPCTAERAALIVRELAAGRAIPVSFTGGEPLVWPAFVAEVARRVRAEGFRAHLETAALHPSELEEVAAVLDHVSADYKLPSTLEQGDWRREHVACISVAVERGIETAVKLVLTRDGREDEWRAALQDLAPFKERICLVLQPVTPFGAVREAVDPGVVAQRAEEARHLGFDVRVIPQVHKGLAVP
jgi:organic radical activating enzyme